MVPSTHSEKFFSHKRNKNTMSNMSQAQKGGTHTSASFCSRFGLKGIQKGRKPTIEPPIAIDTNPICPTSRSKPRGAPKEAPRALSAPNLRCFENGPIEWVPTWLGCYIAFVARTKLIRTHGSVLLGSPTKTALAGGSGDFLDILHRKCPVVFHGFAKGFFASLTRETVARVCTV